MKKSTLKSTGVALSGVALAAGSSMALAGTGGDTEFGDIYDLVSQWTEGTLGKTLGVSSLLVGLGIGVIKQSVMAAVVGVALALVAGFGPGVIDEISDAGLMITTMI